PSTSTQSAWRSLWFGKAGATKGCSTPRGGITDLMNVVVASLNPAKVDAVRAVFGRIWPQCRVSGVKVAIPERISEMPTGRRIKEGALFRARAAAAKGVDF